LQAASANGKELWKTDGQLQEQHSLVILII
jgi:hypothetical protein